MASATTHLARPRSWAVSAWIVLGVIPASLVLGYAANSRTIALVVVFGASLAATAVGIRRKWGAAICLAPVFLLPVTVMTSLPDTGSLKPRFILAVISAILATAYWRQGAGKPELNRWALSAAGFLFVALIALGQRTHTSLQESASLPLFAYSGLIVGQCLRSPKAMRAVAVLAVPLATLAILETLGFEHVWSVALHANTYTALSEENSASRSTSSFGHPLIAGACLTATGLLLMGNRQRLTTLAGAFCLLAAVTTVSRSSLIGGAAGLLIYTFQARGHRLRNVAVLAVLVLAIVAVVSSVPSLRRSVERRVTGVNQGQLSRDESVRSNSLSIIKHEFNADPNRLLIGGGVGYSIRLLSARGGNLDGYDIFDNEYITMMYDGGFLLALVVFALLIVAAITATRNARRVAFPALLSLVVVMYFVDGMEWPSLSLVTWMVIGYYTLPTQFARAYRHPRSSMAQASPPVTT
jgi:hypothetical protein